MKGKKQFKFFQYNIFFLVDIASFCIVFELIHKEIKKNVIMVIEKLKKQKFCFVFTLALAA